MRDRLLILGCSARKCLAVGERAPFVLAYDGPHWQMLRASGFPLGDVAALSAEYGFLYPGTPIEFYEREMTPKRSATLSNLHTTNDPCECARLIGQYAQTFVVAGALYRPIVDVGLQVFPEFKPRVTFARGSFLQMRKQLGEWLRANQKELF